MKLLKYILLFVTVSFILPVEAYELEKDTMMKIESPVRVVITENSAGLEIDAENKTDGTLTSLTLEYPDNSSVTSRQTTFKDKIKGILDGNSSKCRGCSKFDFVIDGICIGLVNAAGQGQRQGFQWAKSFEISWLECLGAAYSFGYSSLSIGLGFNWRNYKVTTDNLYLVPSYEKGIVWDRAADGIKVKGSRLKVFSLQIPLLFRLHIPKTSLYFKCGPILDFNTYASIKTKFENLEGIGEEFFTKGIKVRPFTVDFFGSISLCRAVGVYVRYSPMKVMDALGSINFRPLSLGVCFGI